LESVSDPPGTDATVPKPASPAPATRTDHRATDHHRTAATPTAGEEFSATARRQRIQGYRLDSHPEVGATHRSDDLLRSAHLDLRRSLAPEDVDE